MSDQPRVSPADVTTGDTIRHQYKSGEAGSEYRSGKKYRVVFKRKTDVKAVEARQVAALAAASESGAAICEKCEALKKKENAARRRPRARKRSAAPPPSPAAPPSREQRERKQATALANAASTGAAVCEKC